MPGDGWDAAARVPRIRGRCHTAGAPAATRATITRPSAHGPGWAAGWRDERIAQVRARRASGAPAVTPARTVPVAPPDWISIREASRMLGVSPATLRRWAEAGEVPTFTTPGGHRRFSRGALAARLPAAADARPDLAALGETTDGIVERYRHHGTSAAAPWLGSVPESARERLREHGRAIAASLITSVDAATEGDRRAALATGIDAARDYGRIAGALGASMRQTVATFLFFRRPFVEEMAAVARRRQLDASRTSALLLGSAEAIDHLLDATLAGYEQAMTPRASRGPAEPAR